MRTPLPLHGISRDALRAMEPEILLENLEPLLSHQSKSRFIPGFEEDDKRQEFCIVALRCQQRYDPVRKAGHEGRSASFMHFLISAINNRAIQLAEAGNKQVSECTTVACLKCGWEKGVWQPGCCYVCGGEAWKPVWGAHTTSLDVLLEWDETTESQRGMRSDLGYTVPDRLEDREAVLAILRLVPADERPMVVEALQSQRIPKAIQKLLLARFAQLGRVYSDRRAKRSHNGSAAVQPQQKG